MQRFIGFVAKYKEYFTFTALVVISLSFISMGNVTQIGGFRAVIIGTAGWLQTMFAWIPNPAALKSENRALRELNLQLSGEVVKAKQALNENNALRALLAFKTQAGAQPLISADVIGKTSIELRNYITLNKGEKDGSDEGMTVRTDAGLVGLIVAASDNYSLVELITNKNVKISAKVQRNNINGIVVWDGGDDFLLKNIPESYDVQIGDILLTSNQSNKYPIDVPIARVVDSKTDHGSLFRRILLKPLVNFSTLEQVFIIKQVSDPERIELIKQMEQRLKEARAKK